MSKENKTAVTLEPLGERVVIRQRDAEKLKSAIIVPDQYQEKPFVGEILALGKKMIRSLTATTAGTVEAEAREVKIGDVVVFNPFTAKKVLVAGEEYFIEEESKLLALVRE